jgi:acid phosphatase
MNRTRPVALVLAAVLLGACSSGGPAAPAAEATGGSTTRTGEASQGPAGSATGSPAGSGSTPARPGRPTKLLTIVEENEGAQAALTQMPYLSGLAASYGHTTDYRALTHPSLPNYLAMVGGSTFGVADDAPPTAHPLPGRSVFDLALDAGRTAKAYIESMPGPCALDSGGRYAARHNPWTYFAGPAERSHCRSYDLPAGSPSAGPLHDDVTAGTLPTLGWLTPDLCHDGHDCPLAVADDWLRGWLPVIMNGPDFRAGRLAVVVTFDEDEGTGTAPVLTVVIAPVVRHAVSAVACTHYCWTRYAAGLAGVPAPNLAGRPGVPSLGAAFGLG